MPHYEVNVYIVTPEFRTCMTCDMLHGAPICNPCAPSSRSGKSFFTYAFLDPAGVLSNMPPNYEFDAFAAIPLMGSHAWNFVTQPNIAEGRLWTEPMWIMGPYDGLIVDYEPMFPISFVQGETNNAYSEALTYVGQSENYQVHTVCSQTPILNLLP
jgi:hypothetical protein